MQQWGPSSAEPQSHPTPWMWGTRDFLCKSLHKQTSPRALLAFVFTLQSSCGLSTISIYIYNLYPFGTRAQARYSRAGRNNKRGIISFISCFARSGDTGGCKEQLVWLEAASEVPEHPSSQNNPSIVPPRSPCGGKRAMGLSAEHTALFVYPGKQPKISVLGIFPHLCPC